MDSFDLYYGEYEVENEESWTKIKKYGWFDGSFSEVTTCLDATNNLYLNM